MVQSDTTHYHHHCYRTLEALTRLEYWSASLLFFLSLGWECSYPLDLELDHIAYLANRISDYEEARGVKMALQSCAWTPVQK